MAMKKSKSYMDNPALQFISTALVDEAAAPLNSPETEAGTESGKAPEAEAPALREAPKARQEEEPAKKAEEGSLPETLPEAPLPVPKKAAERKREKPDFPVPMKPMYVEVRSKRLNLLLQPSLFTKLQKIAKKDGVSVNELIHRALSSYCEGRGY